MTQVSYIELRQNLARYMDEAIDSAAPLLLQVTRRPRKSQPANRCPDAAALIACGSISTAPPGPPTNTGRWPTATSSSASMR